jgi:hypothetical protein
MSEQQITKESIAYLKSILLSQLLLEANEELVATNRYKQKPKTTTKQSKQHLRTYRKRRV